MTLLTHLLLWHPPVSVGRALSYTAAALAVAAAIASQGFAVDGARLPDEHAVTSLELAMVRAYCGRPSSYSRAARVAAAIRDDHSLRHTPLRTLVEQRAGSIAAYCEQADQPFVNNENSLMLIESALLRARPGISLAQLGQSLHVARIAALAAFVLVMFALGASLWLGLGVMLSGLIVLDAMPEFVYSAYPFLFVAVLALASLAVAGLHYGWTRRPWPAAAFGAAAGIGSALVVNLRTSYAPIVIVFLAGVLAAQWRSEREPSRRWTLSAAFLASVMAGYLALYFGAIATAAPPGTSSRLSHSIVHPLVLALAVPPTEFSRSVGITWDDAAGPGIARRVDPESDFLGPRYNRAMAQFYRQLWSDHTREMLDLYRYKFAMAGSDMLRLLRSSPGSTGTLIAILLAPLDWIARIAWLVVIEGAIAVTCWIVFWRRGSLPAFGLALLSAAAALLQVEAGVIYSLFVQQYHNFSAFFVLFLSLTGAQALMNAVRASGSRP